MTIHRAANRRLASNEQMASHGASDVPKGVTVPAFRGSALRRRSPSSTTGADTPLPAKLWAVTVPTVQVRDIADVDRPWLRELVASMWGLPVVTSVHAYEDPQRLDGVIAEVDGEPVGAVTFHVDGPEWEVVTVNAMRSGVGAGRAMLEGACRRAEAAGASRVWLITTDTNDGAIGFYEHLGMRRVRLHRRFIDVVRAAKPEVDEGAFCDAIEFEWRIGLGSGV